MPAQFFLYNPLRIPFYFIFCSSAGPSDFTAHVAHVVLSSPAGLLSVGALATYACHAQKRKPLLMRLCCLLRWAEPPPLVRSQCHRRLWSLRHAPPIASTARNSTTMKFPLLPLIQSKIYPLFPLPKLMDLNHLQRTMPLAQFLWPSARLAIPELYKGANPFATPPHIHFDHQVTSSLLPPSSMCCHSSPPPPGPSLALELGYGPKWSPWPLLFLPAPFQQNPGTWSSRRLISNELHQPSMVTGSPWAKPCRGLWVYRPGPYFSIVKTISKFLETSFFHIFSTVTPNQMILTPKFPESHPLSLWAIYILIIVAFVSLYAWALGEFVLKPMNEDFQDQVYEDFKINYMRLQLFFLKQQGKCPWTYCTYYFSVYSVD
jgi:hypothetical protein